MSVLDEQRKERMRLIKISSDLWMRKGELLQKMEELDLEFVKHWHSLGHTDKTMAKPLGVRTHRIEHLRKKLGLDSNYDREKERINNLRRKDYHRGLSDRDLALKWGITEPAVIQWRYKNNLPPNEDRRKTVDEMGRMADYREGWTDSELTKLWGITKTGVIGWRHRRGLPPNSKRRY